MSDAYIFKRVTGVIFFFHKQMVYYVLTTVKTKHNIYYRSQGTTTLGKGGCYTYRLQMWIQPFSDMLWS